MVMLTVLGMNMPVKLVCPNVLNLTLSKTLFLKIPIALWMKRTRTPLCHRSGILLSQLLWVFRYVWNHLQQLRVGFCSTARPGFGHVISPKRRNQNKAVRLISKIMINIKHSSNFQNVTIHTPQIEQTSWSVYRNKWSAFASNMVDPN